MVNKTIVQVFLASLIISFTMGLHSIACVLFACEPLT